MEVTEALKARVKKKLDKLEKRTDIFHKADVEFSYNSGESSNKNTCEITIYADRVIFRAHSESEDMYAAIDDSVRKVKRQLKKHKGKSYASENKHSVKPTMIKQEKEEKPRVVKRKRFEIWNTNIDDAIDQMEYLDHDFFVFVNRENDKVSVLYKRKDGNLGLIETDYIVG